MKKIIARMIGLYLNVLALVAPARAARKGFALFCRPFRGKLLDHHIAFLNTAQKFEVALGSETIQAYRWGTGDKNILLLHGWQSHSFRWKNYVDALDKTQFSIYSFDAPGHGLSTGNFLTVPHYSEAVVAIAKKIGKLHTVIGHSLGGFTGIYTFYHRPSLAPKKMVAMAPPGEATEFVEFFQQALGLSNRCITLVVAHFEKTVNNLPAFFSAPRFAGSLPFPGLIIHDEEDTETLVVNSKKIHAAWTDSQLILTRGKGHNLKSVDVLKDVVRFVENYQEHEVSVPQ
ncbi:MAG: alpha/beta hydrolase [Cyclobacteriaceae bacterium]|nr:alpha/beta hydrolase [Cyclobacteriaceae bacterium]